MVLCHLQRRPPGWLGPCKRLVIAGGLRKQPFGPPSCLGAAGASPVAPTAPAWPGPVARPDGPVSRPPQPCQALRAPLRGRYAVTELLQPCERLSIGIGRPLLERGGQLVAAP